MNIKKKKKSVSQNLGGEFKEFKLQMEFFIFAVTLAVIALIVATTTTTTITAKYYKTKHE